MNDLFEKIAGMLARGVPQNQIADVCGLSDGRISQIKDEPEFKEIYARIMAEYYEERELFDKGWDGVEQHAIAKVLNHLKISSDPDYALKAAVFANKAERRNRAPGNDPIPAQVGQGVVLRLNGAFLDRLNQLQVSVSQHGGEVRAEISVDSGDGTNGTIPEGNGQQILEGNIVESTVGESRRIAHTPQKNVNMLAPSAVEKLFNMGGRKVREEEMSDLEDAIEAAFTPHYVSA